MNIGVGYDNQKNSFSCGVSVAEKASKCFADAEASFVFAVCCNKHDHESYYKGLRSVLGDSIPIVGGSAVGVITKDDLSYEGYPAGAVVFQSNTLKCNVQWTSGLDKSVKQVGIDIAEKTEWSDKTPLFFFYDSIKKAASESSPPVMNSSVPLLNGLVNSLKKNITIIGAGLIGDFSFSLGKIFTGSEVVPQAAVGFQLLGDFEIQSRIMHGCTPLDGVYHTITKAKGPVVFEVDSKPIAKIIDDIYGHKLWRKDNPVTLVSLGVNHGPRYGRPEEKNYLNRLIVGALPNSDAVMLFEPDLSKGDEIQFMLRDSEEMIQSVKTNTETLFSDLTNEGKEIIFGLYIDCAGRSKCMSKTDREEAGEVQDIFKHQNIPLFGFYSGAEIAPLLNKSKGLDWTGVLTLFYR